MPADQDAFERESLAEKNDVALISLLGSLGQSIKEAKEVGSKFATIENARQVLRKGMASMENTMDPNFLDQDPAW